MGLLQLKLSMFLLISAVCFKISVQSPTCGNNTFFIQYPFKLLQEGQNPHHITPYDLRCNGQGVVVLNLPFSGEFYVRDIDYFQQKIQLYDPSNCLPRRLKNLSLSSSPFVAVSYQKYTFFSCPLASLSSHNLTVIRCLSNSTASVVAASENSMTDDVKNLTTCKVMYSLQVPVPQVFEYVYHGIEGDLQLAWNDPSSKRDSIAGKTSSRPGALTIILICAVTISIALLVALFCLGCGLSVVVVMLDIEEANYQSSWSCSSTRVWERARIRLRRASSGAAGPLDEVSFMSSSSQQPQSSAPMGAAAPFDESSSMPPTPSVAAVHPFGHFLSFSSPQVPRGAPAALDELPSTRSPNVAADALDGFVSVMSSPVVLNMPAADDGEIFIDAGHPDEDLLSPSRVPGGAAAPLDESPSPSTLPSPSIAAVHPCSYSISVAASSQGLSGASTPLDELPSTLSSPSVAADATDGFVSVIPSPEVPSMPAAHDDGFFIDDSAVISSAQVPRGAAAPRDESPSTLPPMPPPLPSFPPPPPPPSVADGHPFDYFFSLLSAHFGRRNAASLDELSSTSSSPSVADDFSVIHSPEVPGIAGDALEVHEDEFSFHEELPTEDIIIGGSECIFGPNGDSCTICLRKYKASQRLRLIRKCNHCFHADCLEQWLQINNTCPICRTTVI